MSNEGDDVVGSIITIILYLAFKAGIFFHLMDGFSKGEYCIFLVVLGFIVIWSVIHAIMFVMDIIATIAWMIWREVTVNREKNKTTLKIIEKKLREIYSVITRKEEF